MLAALLSLLLSVSPPGDPAALAVERALAGAPAGGARAAAATAPLRGAPYAHDALGEEDAADPDPRFRLDAFDCLTFAETAVALGSASSLEEARRAIDDVRYGGAAPRRAARHHEALSQWIPTNVARGWIRDVAAEVAPGLTRREEKVYSAASWAEVRRAGRAIAGLPQARLPAGAFAVDVVPLEELPAVAARIPPGTLAFVVRADAADRATRVTHVGLVFAGPGGAPWVRHATSTAGVARVIEEPLSRFVERNRRARPAWPIAGLALLEILDNRAHLVGTTPRAPGTP